MNMYILLVRRELERVEQIADTAVVQVQDEAADFRSVQEQVEKQAKTTVAYVETLQRDVESASMALQTELQALKKKVRTIDQRVQQQATQSIDEDSLMTQLTELQEHYETELNQHKDAFLTKFLDKQQAFDALKMQIHQLGQASHQDREDAIRATAALDTQLKSLKHYVHELDRERQASADKQGRLKGELDELGHRVDRRLDDFVTKHQLQQQLQQLQDQYLKLQHQPMPGCHPPPPLPFHHHPFPPSEDPAMKEKMHLLGRDVHLIAEDLRRFTILFDSRLDEVHQSFTTQLRDLRGELFAALDHDSRQHVIENKRLRDMVFGLEGTFHDGMGRMEEKLQRMDDNARRMDEHMRRIEENVRRMAVERQAPRSPPRRPLDAYAARSSSRHYEDRCGSGGSLYNDQPTMHAAPPSHVGPIVAPRRSRSRSRSNPRDRMQRSSVGRLPHRSEYRLESSSTFLLETGITALNNRSVSPEVDQRQPSSQPASHVASTVQSDDVQMAVVSDSGPDTGARASERAEGDRDREGSSQEEVEHRPTAPPIRRNKKPRKPHEVIVIEDDESADDMIVAPDRAPPDVVTEDDEDSRYPRTVVIREEGDVDLTSGDDVSASDRLKRLSDLRLGSLLYFCFGGAPSLDFEWTRYFSKLNPDDCIEMSRATSFLHRYPGLHSFPIYLAQFIVQAIVVEVPLGGTQSEPLTLGSDDGSLVENVDPALVTDQFQQVLNKIRLSWAETLVVELQKMLERTRDVDPAVDLQLSVNPALIEQAEEAKKINSASWHQQQAKLLWLLLRRLRFASMMPAFTGDMVASPGVYVFLLMFDVVQVNRLSPQSGTFRLTNWGRVLVIQLWDHLLSKLPYLLFADCSWLENQTDSSGTLPTLGFCHILSAILAWTSITDKAIESSTYFYSVLVRLFLDCLHVNGVRVRDSEDFMSLVMNEAGADGAAAAEIELIGVDTKLFSLLQLDGFFEVAHAIASQATAVVPPIVAVDA